VFCSAVPSYSTKRQRDAAPGWAGSNSPTSDPDDRIRHRPLYRLIGTSRSIGVTFVRRRLRLQQQIHALQEAHEQGLALDMAMAAQDMVVAASELAATVQQLLVRKARKEASAQDGHARWQRERMRRARLNAQVKNALYETRALQESITDLFEACLRPEAPDPSSAWPNGRPPAESYPWLRTRLESSAALIQHTLALHDERREERYEQSR